MADNKIVNSILAVVCYFDLFDYPLTLLEIHKYLMAPANIATVSRAVEELVASGRLAVKFGCYFLPARHALVNIRRQRYVLARTKFRRVIWVAKIFSLFPFVRQIALCGSLAYSNAKIDSDIDLFVVTAAGRVWTVRFLVNGLLSLCRLRPRGEHKQDKICTGLFVSEDSLDLSFISHYQRETHLIYWFFRSVFIYGESTRFFAANSWLKQILPNFYSYQPNLKRRVSGSGFWLEWLFKLAPERLFKKIQLAIMPAEYLALAKRGQDVILSDQVVKIHTSSSRQEIANRLAEKLNNLKINEAMEQAD
ncbi:MAG TPA: nucleotidyltransferase domain-containing protein [bacterium]|nr:nucleotidyltransferase domain-containing protein [bacterium]